MEKSGPHRLPDRGLVELSGDDAVDWLDNLVAGDLTRLTQSPAVFTALLSPQGKILFEFFVWKPDGRFLIDVAAAQLVGLTKRLKIYKLRSRVEIRDVTADWHVVWCLGGVSDLVGDGVAAIDPRTNGGLWRGIYPGPGTDLNSDDGAYLAARVRLGTGEAPDDYTLGDIFPHEANMDLFGGVSFSKGCYVGQEVVSRMQNKTVVRKRVVRVASDSSGLTPGAEIRVGDGVIGRIGSVSDRAALALIRLDRVIEARDSGMAIVVDGRPISVDSDAIDRYRQSVKERPVLDL